MDEELKHCPSCQFTKEKYNACTPEQRGYLGGYGGYTPIIYKETLFNIWVIVCQNCGMAVLFNLNKDECIKHWNELPR